jgi:ADP-ribose pyrophosphatase
MIEKSWTIVNEQQVFEAKPFVTILRQHVITDQGENVPDYYQVALPNFALVCALTPEEKVVTLWQYRHGARAYGLTFPAGQIDPGETAEAAAGRELREETGYRADSAQFVGRCAVSDSQGCGFAHLFVMRNCLKVGETCSDDHGTTDLRLMTMDEIETAIRNQAVMTLPHLALWACAKAHDFCQNGAWEHKAR